MRRSFGTFLALEGPQTWAWTMGMVLESFWEVCVGCVDDCCGWSFCEGSRWTLMITRLGNRNGLQTRLLFKRVFFFSSPFLSLVFFLFVWTRKDAVSVTGSRHPTLGWLKNMNTRLEHQGAISLVGSAWLTRSWKRELLKICVMGLSMGYTRRIRVWAFFFCIYTVQSLVHGCENDCKNQHITASTVVLTKPPLIP